jgi:hypothetical protein
MVKINVHYHNVIVNEVKQYNQIATSLRSSQ